MEVLASVEAVLFRATPSEGLKSNSKKTPGLM